MGGHLTAPAPARTPCAVTRGDCSDQVNYPAKASGDFWTKSIQQCMRAINSSIFSIVCGRVDVPRVNWPVERAAAAKIMKLAIVRH